MSEAAKFEEHAAIWNVILREKDFFFVGHSRHEGEILLENVTIQKLGEVFWSRARMSRKNAHCWRRDSNVCFGI